MKKTYIFSLVAFALIPVVMVSAGAIFSAIDPEMAAGHADYERNYRLLEGVRQAVLFGGFLVSLGLWLVSCFLLLMSKGRSWLWMVLAALGPLGFAAMAMLRDREPRPAAVYCAFLGRLGPVLRFVYEALLFVGIWMLAFWAVILKNEWTAILDAGRRGVPVSQILRERDASSGMWAFSDGLEIMYLVVLLYLLWPLAIHAVGGLWRQFRQHRNAPVKGAS